MKPIFHRQHSKAQKMRWIFIQNELDNLQTVYRIVASVKVCHKQPKQSKGWMKYRKLTNIVAYTVHEDDTKSIALHTFTLFDQ